MFMVTVILGVVVVILSIAALTKGRNNLIDSYRAGLNTLVKTLPLLLVAFFLAGMLEVLLPPELISRWMGAESGFGGILLGTVAGGILPAGPYITFPIFATLYRAGASVPVIVAVITGWCMWGTSKIPFEMAFFGPKFTILRYGLVLIFPPLAGLIAQVLL